MPIPVPIQRRGSCISITTFIYINRIRISFSVRTKHPVLSKVNQLMALCDELEAGLVQAQIEGGELMEAVVHHVLAG